MKLLNVAFILGFLFGFAVSSVAHADPIISDGTQILVKPKPFKVISATLNATPLRVIQYKHKVLLACPAFDTAECDDGDLVPGVYTLTLQGKHKYQVYTHEITILANPIPPTPIPPTPTH